MNSRIPFFPAYSKSRSGTNQEQTKSPYFSDTSSPYGTLWQKFDKVTARDTTPQSLSQTTQPSQTPKPISYLASSRFNSRPTTLPDSRTTNSLLPNRSDTVPNSTPIRTSKTTTDYLRDFENVYNSTEPSQRPKSASDAVRGHFPTKHSNEEDNTLLDRYLREMALRSPDNSVRRKYDDIPQSDLALVNELAEDASLRTSNGLSAPISPPSNALFSYDLHSKRATDKRSQFDPEKVNLHPANSRIQTPIVSDVPQIFPPEPVTSNDHQNRLKEIGEQKKIDDTANVEILSTQVTNAVGENILRNLQVNPLQESLREAEVSKRQQLEQEKATITQTELAERQAEELKAKEVTAKQAEVQQQLKREEQQQLLLKEEAARLTKELEEEQKVKEEEAKQAQELVKEAEVKEQKAKKEEGQRIAKQQEKQRLMQVEKARLTKETEVKEQREFVENQAKIEKESQRIAKELETERLQKEATADRLAKAEEESVARKLKQKAEELFAEQLEQKIAEESKAKEEAERQSEEIKRIAKESAETVQIAKELETERSTKEFATDERLAKEAEEKRIEQEKQEKEEAERLANEAEAKRLEERIAKEAEAKRLEDERTAKEEQERIARESDAKKLEERLAKEAEQKRIEEERLANEETKRREAERLAKEAEEKRIAEEEEKKEQEQRAREAEAKRLEEEQNAKEEQERIAHEAETKRLVEMEEQERLIQMEIADAPRITVQSEQKPQDELNAVENTQREASEKRHHEERLAKEEEILEMIVREAEVKRIEEEKAKSLAKEIAKKQENWSAQNSDAVNEGNEIFPIEVTQTPEPFDLQTMKVSEIEVPEVTNKEDGPIVPISWECSSAKVILNSSAPSSSTSSFLEFEESVHGSCIVTNSQLVVKKVSVEQFTLDSQEEEIISFREDPISALMPDLHDPVKENHPNTLEDVSQVNNTDYESSVPELSPVVPAELPSREGWNKTRRDAEKVEESIQPVIEVSPLTDAGAAKLPASPDSFDEFPSPRISYGSSSSSLHSASPPIHETEFLYNFQDSGDEKEELSPLPTRKQKKNCFAKTFDDLSARSQRTVEVKTPDLKRSVQERDMALSVELRRLVKQDPPLPAPQLFMKKWNLIRKRKIAPTLHPERKVQRTNYRVAPSKVYTEEEIERDAYIY